MNHNIAVRTGYGIYSIYDRPYIVVKPSRDGLVFLNQLRVKNTHPKAKSYQSKPMPMEDLWPGVVVFEKLNLFENVNIGSQNYQIDMLTSIDDILGKFV